MKHCNTSEETLSKFVLLAYNGNMDFILTLVGVLLVLVGIFYITATNVLWGKFEASAFVRFMSFFPSFHLRDRVTQGFFSTLIGIMILGYVIFHTTN